MILYAVPLELKKSNFRYLYYRYFVPLGLFQNPQVSEGRDI
ncbi:MAG: hypothetical protein ACJASM_003039, partial [Salibacteraceae bacterium]